MASGKFTCRLGLGMGGWKGDYNFYEIFTCSQYWGSMCPILTNSATSMSGYCVRVLLNT